MPQLVLETFLPMYEWCIVAVTVKYKNTYSHSTMDDILNGTL